MLDPAGLRGGGATALWQKSQDPSLVQWRGRWASFRTMSIYVQELSASSLFAELDSGVKQAIHVYAAAAHQLILVATILLQDGTDLRLWLRICYKLLRGPM